MSDLLVDTQATDDVTSASAWANVPGLGAAGVTVGAASSVVLLIATIPSNYTNDNSDDGGNLRFAIDGMREGPEGLWFKDNLNDACGISLCYAVTGLSGPHEFRVEWRSQNGGTRHISTSTAMRSFQVIELTDASLLVDLSSTAVANAGSSYADIPNMVASPSVAGVGSILLILANWHQDDEGDASGDTKFQIDNVDVGPELSTFSDATEESCGYSGMWFDTGFTGATEFAMQWRENETNMRHRSGKERRFQVIEITANANLLSKITSIASGSLSGSFADVGGLVDTVSVASTGSILIFASGISPNGQSGDDTGEFRIGDGGVEEGPSQLVFHDGGTANDNCGHCVYWATTGKAAGSHTFSLRGVNVVGDFVFSTSKRRSLSIVELLAGGVVKNGTGAGSGTATLSAAAGAIRLATLAITGTATALAAAGAIHLGTASISGTATVAAAAGRIQLATVAVSGTGTASADAYVIRAASTAISGTATASADAEVIRAATAAISGTATTAGTAEAIREATVSVSGTSTVAGAAGKIQLATVVVSGTAAVTGAAGKIQLATVAASGTATTVGAGARIAAGSGAVSGTVSTVAAGGRVTLGTAAVSGTATVAGVGGGVRLATVAVAGTGTTQAAAGAVRLATLAVSGSASTAGAGTVVPGGGEVKDGTVAVSGTATSAASALRLRYGTTAVTGTATSTATAYAIRLAAAAVSGTATVASVGGRVALGAVVVSGTATSSAAGLRTAYGTVALSGTASSNGAAFALRFNTGGIAGGSDSLATAHAIRAATGANVGTATLAAQAIRVTDDDISSDAFEIFPLARSYTVTQTRVLSATTVARDLTMTARRTLVVLDAARIREVTDA